jgi:crotonobetainyl-CoA:carnitine CoA-transferase CaiB-like acyl-CoA transferase
MEGPLDDILVIDLTAHLAGPFATRILADLGAHVIKVEPRTGRPPFPVPRPGPVPLFAAANRGKQSISLDLKKPEARAVLGDLVATADVLIENFRPGVTRRLGVHYEAIREQNPKIVYCSITGFGSTGPLAEKPAFDAVIQAMSGAMFSTGEPDRSPALMTAQMGDLASSCMAAPAILAALHGQQRTGRGCHLDISMLESLMYLLPSQTQGFYQWDHIPQRSSSSYGFGSIVGAFETSDKKWVQVLCPYTHFQERLAAAAARVPGCESLTTDERFQTPLGRNENSDEFLELVGRAIATDTQEKWLAILTEADVPCAPIHDISEALAIPQLEHRGFIREIELSEVGVCNTVGSPFKTSDVETPKRVEPCPEFAEHTEEVLRDRLGYAPERIAELRAAEVI